jgi:hypothetical protein
MTTRQTVQHAGKICLGVETGQLCGLDDRIQDGRAVTAAIGTKEQKIFARDSNHPFILPMSGKSWKSIIRGIRFSDIRSLFGG